MPQVSEALRADTERTPSGSYHFTLVSEAAGVTARSTSTYHSQADAVAASSRMAEGEGLDAAVVERDGGYAVRFSGGNLEAITDAYPDRSQADTTLAALTG